MGAAGSPYSQMRPKAVAFRPFPYHPAFHAQRRIAKTSPQNIIKILKFNDNICRVGGGRRRLGVGSGPVPNACFLRNTRLKTAPIACGKGASSLHQRAQSLMSEMRRRGHPRVVLFGKKSRIAGRQGEVPSVLSHWADTEPSHDKQCFGGSR